MKILFLTLLTCFLRFLNPIICCAQNKAYQVSFVALADSLKANPKPVIIKMGTTWCAYCQLQSKQIKQSAALQRLLSENYYFLELDAESKDVIPFQGQHYGFVPTGNGTGYHQLSQMLMDKDNDNILSGYPMWIILSPELKTINRYSGFLTVKKLLSALKPGR